MPDNKEQQPTKVVSTAPGKLVLLGEYCVLEGAPALAIAVDRMVTVDIRSTKGGDCTVSSVPSGAGPARFRMQPDGTIAWLDGQRGSAYGLLESVTSSLSEGQMLSLERASRFDMEIDSSPLYDTDTAGRNLKLGLGSSAAVTVALSLGLHAFTGRGRLSDENWLSIMVEAHRRFQGGLGSGIDIAASLHGGAIGYASGGAAPRVDRLNLPSDLQWAFAWSGRSSSTGDMLRRLRSWRVDHLREYDRMMVDLGDLSVAGLSAIRIGDSAGFLGAARRFTDALSEFGGHTGLEIFGPGHTELLAMANEVGLVYKPCGAGGGDFGVAMGLDPTTIQEFVSRLDDTKYKVMNFSVSPDGVRVIRS